MDARRGAGLRGPQEDHGDATRRLDREDVEGATKTPEDGVGPRGILRRPGGRQKRSVRSKLFLKAKLQVDGQRHLASCNWKRRRLPKCDWCDALPSVFDGRPD